MGLGCVQEEQKPHVQSSAGGPPSTSVCPGVAPHPAAWQCLCLKLQQCSCIELVWVQGEDQKKLDILANEVFINVLRSSGQCAVLVSASVHLEAMG